MKRVIMAVLTLMFLQVINVAPSHAIFGLSQCEKMWNAIEDEESIGRELWNDFRAEAGNIDKVTSPTMSAFMRGATFIIPVYESDLKVFDIAIKNKECFAIKGNAKVRTLKQFTQEKLRAAQQGVSNAQKNGWQTLYNVQFKWMREYPNYKSLSELAK